MTVSLNVSILSSRHDVLVLDSKCRETIVALCIYLLDSQLRFAGTFIPLLRDVLAALPRAEWVVMPEEQNAYNLPVAECFSFAFSALFSEIMHRQSKLAAAKDGENSDGENADGNSNDESDTDSVDDQVLDAFVSALNTFVLTLKNNEYHEALCKYTVPSLFGLLRGFARVSPYSDVHVGDLLFPSGAKHDGVVAASPANAANEGEANVRYCLADYLYFSFCICALVYCC